MKTAKTTVTIVSALASVILLTSCATKSTETQTSTNNSSDNQITMTYDQLRSRENTMSTLWYQKAAETKALYLQGYNVATDRLKELLKTESDKPYSIVLDLDETVLDNSPYQVQNVKDGTAFTPENWDVWVQKAAAKAVPGAKDFLQFADQNGVQIYYISDRSVDQVEFGEKFIIFPNPMYGSWETAVYGGNKLDAKGQVEEREKALQGFDK